jgi:hypothetical protein
MQVSIKNCARCGEDHELLDFKLLSNPIAEWTHFSICPKTDEPILLEIVETEDE